VISDRFPLPQLSFMDAPQVDREAARRCKSSRPQARLTREAVLPSSPTPDACRPPCRPEIAVARKPEERLACPRRRGVWEIDWLTVPARRRRGPVDAGSAVQVKALVWSQL
jgi:hypothetical protein